jgi:hypothetical protein
MDEQRWTRVLATLLVFYLLVVAGGGVFYLIYNFPSKPNGEWKFPHGPESSDRGMLLLAAVAGATGSFIHGAQSLSSYLGNREFKPSWAAWYFLRPWVGGVLALAIYFVIRAGLVAGTGLIDPHSVVALGLLGGWFSKTTTDKLQEVFETLFKTDEDKKRKDKLTPIAKPIIESIEPSRVPPGHDQLIIKGKNFQKEARVNVGDTKLIPTFESSERLSVSLSDLPQRPTPGSKVTVQVENPKGPNPLSDGKEIEFAP